MSSDRVGNGQTYHAPTNEFVTNLPQILKAAKFEYRATFGDLKELKDAIHTLEDSLTSTRQELVSSEHSLPWISV